jgi:(R,R)-butanediol dehydrogenase / meso-butanediol dehydrogenase / diacetyl reductase
MRGVVFTGDSTLELIEFPDPEPGPRDVILEIKASGMCGSDLKLYRPPAGAAFKALGLVDNGEPVIAGHEPCGVIAAVGKDVDPRTAKVGDRVTLHHYQGCWTCAQCRSGWTQMCDRTAVVYGVTGHGGHAPYMRAAVETVVALPEEVSFAAGAAISCGTGTAYGALLRLDLSARDTIVIVGQGPVGLSATQFAAKMGAQVIAVDVSAERAERAKAFGAAHTIDASATDPVEAIMQLTNGKGAAKALDTSGAPQGRAAAVRSAAKWGKVCFVGEGGDVTLNVSPDIIRKQLTIYGSWTVNSADQADCVRFVADHGVEVDKLFTDTWRLDQAEEAYKAFDKQASGKGVFLN